MTNGRSVEARIRRGKIRTCRQKKVYETPSDASIANFKYYQNHGTLLGVYECSNCKKYHLHTIKTETATPNLNPHDGE